MQLLSIRVFNFFFQVSLSDWVLIEMSQSPLVEDAEMLVSLTSTSSESTCTFPTTTDSVNTQIEIEVTTPELQDAKEESVTPTPSSIKYGIPIPVIGDVESPSHGEEKYRSFDEEVVKYTAEAADGDDEDEEDDDTLSSEAMVDDIELILMPEEAMDLPQVHSPKLVRVRELLTDDSGHLLDDDEDDDCNFRKMDGSERSDRRGYQVDDGSDEGEPMMDEGEGAVGFTNLAGFGRGPDGGGDEEDPSFASSTTSGREPRGKYSRKSLASSGVQTDITALESGHRQPIICDYRFGAGGRKVMTSASGKKLNWKSELTLMPSKTKVGHHFRGLGDGGLMNTGVSIGFNRDEDERDQYSAGCRVAKFTSQVRENS